MKKLEVSSNIVYLPCPGYIYLVNAVGTNKFKIGKTGVSVVQRIACLQVGCPIQLRYVYHGCVENMSRTEKELHSFFNSFRLIGEWFSFTKANVKDCIELIRLVQVDEFILFKRQDEDEDEDEIKSELNEVVELPNMTYLSDVLTENLPPVFSDNFPLNNNEERLELAKLVIDQNLGKERTIKLLWGVRRGGRNHAMYTEAREMLEKLMGGE